MTREPSGLRLFGAMRVGPYARLEIQQHGSRDEVAVVGLGGRRGLAASEARFSPNDLAERSARSDAAHLVKERVLAVPAFNYVLAQGAVRLDAVLQAKLLPKGGTHCIVHPDVAVRQRRLGHVPLLRARGGGGMLTLIAALTDVDGDNLPRHCVGVTRASRLPRDGTTDFTLLGA